MLKFCFGPAEASGGEPDMEKKAAVLSTVAVLFVLCFAAEIHATESPQYTVVHAESDFEVRLYVAATWMSASAKGISFREATYLGFHRLFQYIQGANLNNSRIPMTYPVVTSIVPGARPLHLLDYVVLFYLPVKFQASPPVALPELQLQSRFWNSHCIAVRKFSGVARDHNIMKEVEQLALSLSRSSWANATSSESKFAYSIAQYDSPLRLIGRVNEVWVIVDSSGAEDCASPGVATY